MTITSLLTEMTFRLERAGVESSRLDAELIILHVKTFPRHIFIADPLRELSISG